MWYVTVICIPRDGSPRRECVKNYPIDTILGTTLAQALDEARKLCPLEQGDLDIHVSQQQRP